MISAKIVADSITPTGDRLTTLEVVMPRYILAEGKTHRSISGMLEQTTIETSIGLNDEYYLSKNSASSRAIPFNKMVKEVQDNPFIPYAWQKDHKGMQGNDYITGEKEVELCKETWLNARNSAIRYAKNLNDKNAFPNGDYDPSYEEIDITKQLCNRLLEAFMYHKVLVSGTEWENFFNLRCPQYMLMDSNADDTDTYVKSRKEWIEQMNIIHNDVHDMRDYSILDWLKINKGQADIHMMFLAEAIYDAMNESIPNELNEGEWHIPYGEQMDFTQLVVLGIDKGLLEQKENIDDYCNQDDENIVDGLRNKISVARCARLSYQTLGDNPEINYEKDLQLYETLVKSGHASPTEHVARVMSSEEYKTYFKQEGLKSELGWSRNYRGFRQMREIIDL